MDPAEKEQMAAILRAQEARLSQQEEYQKAMATQLGHLSVQVRDLLDHLRQTSSPSVAPQTQAAAPGPPAPVSPAPYTGSGIKLASPERYSGDPGQCKAFLTDCDIHFEHSPQAFPTDRSRVAFMVSHLTGRARAWATAEWARDSPLCASVTDFRAALRRVFDPVSTDREKARELSRLRQGNNESVAGRGLQKGFLGSKHQGRPLPTARHWISSTKRTTGVSQFKTPESIPRKLTPIKITCHNTPVHLQALIDSGADESLIDWDLTPNIQT
ncbi:uncharacterized protein V6R79_016353 [Siganus canaliculatus]